MRTRVAKAKIRSVWPGNFLEFLYTHIKGIDVQKLGIGEGRGLALQVSNFDLNQA